MALTFDDGPSPATTPGLVAYLRQAKVKATFFMIGQSVQANPGIVADIAGDPLFEIGEHTWNHPNLNTLGAKAVNSQLTRASDAITGITGKPVHLLRPPYGNHNATVDQCARTLGQAVILWDIDTLDWKYRNSASVQQRALAGVHSGSIILMHDIHPTSVAAVPAIATALRSQGYTLVTVSELLGAPAAGQTYTQRA